MNYFKYPTYYLKSYFQNNLEIFYNTSKAASSYFISSVTNL